MLQVRQLEKVIENRKALAIEQLDMCPGEIVALVGPVGSGKTLLLRLLCGEMTPSGGSIVFEGQNVPYTPAVRRHIGMLFEDDLLYERQSVQDNLGFYCQLHGLPRNRIGEVLALVGMSDQLQKRIAKLSSSAQRRLAFARTLLTRPALLLLDRPTLRTDLDTQAVLARLITQLAAEGTAILLTDEDLAWAGKFCTHIIELEDGRVVGSRSRVRDESSEPTLQTSSSEKQSPVKALEPIKPERLTPFKIPARKEDRILLYDPGDLLYATSRDGKTYLRTAHEEAACNLTLQELEIRLSGRGFFKAHRAYLVNLQHIKAVIQYTRNSYTLQLDDEQETMIPLSKQYEKELQDLLGY